MDGYKSLLSYFIFCNMKLSSIELSHMYLSEFIIVRFQCYLYCVADPSPYVIIKNKNNIGPLLLPYKRILHLIMHHKPEV